MTRTAINPDSMYNAVQFGFSHAVESDGGRLLHLAAQAQQCFANLTEVLACRGATAVNVVRLRTCVVDYSADKLDIIGPAFGAFYGDVAPAANTLVGVQALAMPDFLIEVEAMAILD